MVDLSIAMLVHQRAVSIAITLGNASLHLRTYPYQIAGLISTPHPSNSPLIYINIPFLMVPLIPSYPLKSHHKTFIKLTCSLVTLRKTRVKHIINHSPNHHNMVHTIPKWVVYDIVLPTSFVTAQSITNDWELSAPHPCRPAVLPGSPNKASVSCG